MTNTPKMLIDRRGGRCLIQFGEKFYAVETDVKDPDMKGHVKEVIYSEIDPVEYDKYIEGIVDKLESMVDRRAVLKAALLPLSIKELQGLEKAMLKHKEPTQIRGCYGLKFGKYELGIVP